MKYPASPLNLQTHGVPSPFLRTACRLLLRSFATISHPNALFSIGCSLFSENTRVGGTFSPPSALPTFRPSSFQACRRNFARPLFSTSYKSLPIPPRRKNHLFSYTYKSLFAQPVCFLIDTKPRGVTTHKSGSTCHPRGYPMSIAEGSQRILPAHTEWRRISERCERGSSS